ncbi:hypothetical protein LCGC14_2814390, partial [marine sediment metagenome]
PELWAEKDRRITRVAIAKSIIEVGKAVYVDAEDLNPIRIYADFWFNWVYEQSATPSRTVDSDSIPGTMVAKPFTRADLNKKLTALIKKLNWTADRMREHLRTEAVNRGYQAAAKMEKPSELMSDTELAEVILDLDALTPADKDFQETFGESN